MGVGEGGGRVWDAPKVRIRWQGTVKKGSLIKKLLEKIMESNVDIWYFGQILSNFLEIFSIFF